MTQTVANVAAGSPVATGGVLAGAIGSTLPTSAASTIDAAIKALGYVGEGGLEPTGDPESKTALKAWGGDNVANVITDKATRRFQFTLLEVFNADVANLIFGTANVTAVAAVAGTSNSTLAIQDKAASIDRGVYVFDMKYEGKKMRVVVPNGGLVVTELPFADDSLSGYQCEVDCLPDASGVYVYRYYENDDK